MGDAASRASLAASGHAESLEGLVTISASDMFAAHLLPPMLGRPTNAAAFAEADFIGFNRGDAMIELLARLGFSLTAENFHIVCENQVVQWAMVKQGLGIGVNAAPIGDALPGVERIFPTLEPVMFPVWLVSHRELHTSRRVRRVFDVLADELARDHSSGTR